MSECLDKNMIDKDEYPQTASSSCTASTSSAALERAGPADGNRLLDDGLERGGDARRPGPQAALAAPSQGEGKPADKPNIVMGNNAQVCWEKFADYWDVEMRLVRMEGDRFHLSRAKEAVKVCDEDDRRRRILGSTYDGSYEPVAGDRAALAMIAGAKQDWTSRPHRRASALRAPFPDPVLAWDFRLPRVASINASGQKTARLSRRRLDRLAHAKALPGYPIFWVNYLGHKHADVRPQLLPAGRPGLREY